MTILADLNESDLEAPMAIPERSVLFSLEPQGVSTAHQESLLSLLVRTSHAHAVSPRLLIREVLAQSVPGIAHLSTAAFFQRLASTVNGLGKYADMFVSAMEKLTGQPNLRHLTVLPWRDLFPHNGQGLLARYPRWCPVCLYNQRLQGQIMAFPLIWSLEASKICIRHNLSLEHRCPNCSSTQRVIPRHPNLAVCSNCGGSLDANVRAIEPPSPFQYWVTEAIADMVAQQSTRGFTPSSDRFREFIRECVAAHSGGNRTAFCRALGFNDFAVSGWLNKNERPSITQFLTVCYGTRMMPTDVFLDGSRNPMPATDLRFPLVKLKDRLACPRPAPDRRASLRQALHAHIDADHGQPVSAVARELGVGPACLRYWFPDLCKVLSERYCMSAKKKSEVRHLRQCTVVENVVGRLKKEGVALSKRRVNALLRLDGLSLSQPHLANAYKKAGAADVP